MSGRPGWASGADKDKWEGWESASPKHATFMIRDVKGGIAVMEVWHDGDLHVGGLSEDGATIPFNSPADALEVANLIAEKLGGWGE